MLFDNNSDFDFSFLTLSDVIDNSDEKVVEVNEGFLKGNMFKDEYKPYLNLTYINILPKNELESKLYKIMKYSFAINDLNLYLDVHPNDKEIFELLKKYISEEEKLKKEYVKTYGSLNICDEYGNKYNWIDNPWPWDGRGGNIYV